MRYVANQAGAPVRFIGLSTALANAADLSSWLGVGPHGLFNFKPSVRPVPLECHIQVGNFTVWIQSSLRFLLFSSRRI